MHLLLICQIKKCLKLLNDSRKNMALSADLPTLPDLPLVEIFTMLDFASLHKCRQVCKHWNQMILKDVWGRKTNRGIMEQKYRRYWDTGARQLNSSSRSLGFKPQYIAVSPDLVDYKCFVMRNTIQVILRNTIQLC